MIKKVVIVLFLILSSNKIHSEEVIHQLFSNNLLAYNPAYVSTYQNYYFSLYGSKYFKDEYNYIFSKYRIDYSFPLKKIKSGVGFHNEYIRNSYYTLRDVGFKYGSNFSISQNIEFAIGTNISIQEYSFYSYYIYFDDHPLYSYYGFYTHNEKDNRYNFNVDAGFWVKMHNLQLGLTAQNLNRPKTNLYNMSDTSLYRISRKLNIIANYDIQLGNFGKLQNSIVFFKINQFSEFKRIMVNNLISYHNYLLIGVSTYYKKNMFGGNQDTQFFISPNLGFKIADKFSLILSCIAYRENVTNNIYENTLEGIMTYKF